MDKFELKDKIIEIMDKINELGGEVMNPAAADEETANFRSKVISSLIRTHNELTGIMYNIY